MASEATGPVCNTVEDAGLGAGLQGGPGMATPTSSARMKGVVGTEPVGAVVPLPGQAERTRPVRALLWVARPQGAPSPVHSQVFILLPFSAFFLFSGRKRKKKKTDL